MNGDQRLFFQGSRELSFSERLSNRWMLFVSAEARKKHRQFNEIKGLFADALGDSDDLFRVQTRRKPIRNLRHQTFWIALWILVPIIVLEWSQYTAPLLTEWFSTILHGCGLR